MTSETRIARARRQLRLTRIGIGTAAAAGLAVFGVAARAAHPGAARSGTAGSAASAVVDTQPSFGFGVGSIRPASGSPSIQSGGS